MASEPKTGTLLRTLAASKSGGSFLELGTGTGVGTCWILEGMDTASTLITVEKTAEVSAVAQRILGADKRVTFYVGDAGDFLREKLAQRAQFDFIFADTFMGKFELLEEALGLLKPGGFYIGDDLLPQPNWPEGHAPKVAELVAYFEKRTDLQITTLEWASGLILAAKC
jgi:predicted O-methyltransferase YrrM